MTGEAPEFVGNSVARNSARPLLIVDADEVLLLFVAGLERLLLREGFELRLESFRLTGNIRRRDTGGVLEQAEVGALIARFFAEEMGTLDPAPGAAEALQELATGADVVVLTNTPDASLPARAACLARHGMAYPVLGNAGPKGPAVARLMARRTAPAIFLDDLPPNHESVAEAAPNVLRIQMVADPRLAALAPPTPYAHHRVDDWERASTLIRSHCRLA